MSTPTTSPVPDSISELEAQLERQRAALASDLEQLGARVAPAALKAQAAASVRQAGRDAADRATSAVVAVKDRAVDGALALKEQVADLLAPYTDCSSTGTCPLRQVPDAVTDLLDRARSGEPRALALTTGAAALLAGAGFLAVRKALRS